MFWLLFVCFFFMKEEKKNEKKKMDQVFDKNNFIPWFFLVINWWHIGVRGFKWILHLGMGMGALHQELCSVEGVTDWMGVEPLQHSPQLPLHNPPRGTLTRWNHPIRSVAWPSVVEATALAAVSHIYTYIFDLHLHGSSFFLIQYEI